MVEGDGVYTFTVVARACAGAGGARSGFVQGVVGVARDERVLLRGEGRWNIILACSRGGCSDCYGDVEMVVITVISDVEMMILVLTRLQSEHLIAYTTIDIVSFTSRFQTQANCTYAVRAV